MLVKRRPPRTPKKEHPTKRALIDTVVSMLETTPVESVTCDAVLDASGISRGSLYHHFDDYPDLLEHAAASRFARYVDESIVAIRSLVESVHSAAELRAAMAAFNRSLQGPERVHNRFDRTIALANAARSPRFRVRLGEEQERLTGAFVGLIREGQRKGWVVPEIDPRAMAVLIQAYTLGRVVDDITVTHFDTEAWLALLDRFFASICVL